LVTAGAHHGRLVYVFSQENFTVFGGSLSQTHAQKILQNSEWRSRMVRRYRIKDSGVRVFGRRKTALRMPKCSSAIFEASGVIPQISVIRALARRAVLSPLR